MTNRLIVYVDVGGVPLRAGIAYFAWRRQSFFTSFTYDADYVADRRAFPIDPALDLASGLHQVDRLPGVFQDCSPDRWGRNLIAKRMRLEALRSHRTPPSVSDVDYLIGVSDRTRQGALRFKEDEAAPFLAPDDNVPKLIELPRLLRSAESVARGDDDMAAVSHQGLVVGKLRPLVDPAHRAAQRQSHAPPSLGGVL